MSRHQTLLILDYGSQYTQLIARRVRENRIYCEIHPPGLAADEIRRREPIGVVLSGGPESVLAPGAPTIDPAVFDLGIPVLGVCYGMQLMARLLGGEVESAEHREYGRAEIDIREGTEGEAPALFDGLDERQTVWMSHGDRVVGAPPGFAVAASTRNAPIVAMEDRNRKLHGVQFHPEVSHTVEGTAILRNFLVSVCGAEGDWRMASYRDEAVEEIRERIGSDRVIVALSGGVDSSVVAAIVRRAVGDQLTAVFVDHGLLRHNEASQVMHDLGEGLGIDIRKVDASTEFLGALEGITDPEEKRRTVGRLFIETFDREAADLEGVRFLAQGTLYPDVIESISALGGPSATIKTHHNVGGLPEKLGFELIEPLRFLFKDEVRQLGRELGLPEHLISRHPFPGPGLAVRILGEITPERVETLQKADAIFIEELREAGYYDKVSQAFAVLLPVRTVGVMGDERTYEAVVAIRSVDTLDFMTADWSALPHDLLGRVANRIVNEVAGVNRVVYDVTSKPPGTIEWE